MAIKTFIDPAVLQTDLALNGDLSDRMMTQAGMFAHYAVLSANAQKQAATAKLAMEIRESTLDRDIRAKAAETGSKLTEPLIAKEIARNVDYIKACNDFNEADMIASLAKNTLEAWKQRRDMLVQLGVDAREERKGELYVNAKGAALADAKARAMEIIRDQQSN